MTTTITIPAAPAYALSPNARTHYMAKHNDAQRLKGITVLACNAAPYFEGPVELDWIIRLPKRRYAMDWDNAIATLKPAMDGLVAAGVLDDDNTDFVTRIGLTQIGWREHKLDGGSLEVTITPVNARRESAA